MKALNNIILFLLVFAISGLAETELVERNGLYFKKLDSIPFTGKGVFKGIFIPTFTPDAYVKIKTLNGKLNGTVEVYNLNNGNLVALVDFKKGKREGKEVQYDEDGHKIADIINKNDANCEGWFKTESINLKFKSCKKTGIDFYYEDDTKYKNTWKDGKLIKSEKD